jgi:hypothetical protein
MEKVLNILSLIIKVATIALGGVTASDAAAVHIDVVTLGKIVSGLGSAALGVKFLQAKFVKPNDSQFNK